jgi:hypothetical protein
MTEQTYQEALDAMAGEIRRLYASKATGDLAALRRLDPDHPSAPALHRLIARTVHQRLVGNMDMMRRWARAAHLMALRPDSLRAEGLGEVFVAIGLSDARLSALLNAHGTTLRDLVSRTARRITVSDEPLPYRSLCRLMLLDDRPEHNEAAEELRIRIAGNCARAARVASAEPTTKDV